MEFNVQIDGQQHGPFTSARPRQHQTDSLVLYRFILSLLRKMGLPAVALILISCGDSTPGIQAEADKETARIVAETNTLAEKLKAEREQAQKDYEDAKLKWAEDTRNEAAAREAKDAEEEHKRRMRKLDQEIAAEESKARRAQEDQLRAEERRQAKLAKLQEEEAKEKAKEEASDREQTRLREVAASIYGDLHPAPQIVMSANLRKLGVTAQVKGETIQTLTELYRKQDWLGVYNFARESPVNQLPDAESIRLSLQPLGEKATILHLETSQAPAANKESFAVFYVWERKPGEMRWEYAATHAAKPHPDGKGYLFRAKLKHQNIFIALGDTKLYSRFQDLFRSYQSESDKLQTRLKLAEIDQSQFETAVRDLDRMQLQKIAAWTEAVSTN